MKIVPQQRAAETKARREEVETVDKCLPLGPNWVNVTVQIYSLSNYIETNKFDRP